MKFSPAGLTAVGRELAAPFVVDVCLDPNDDLNEQTTTELTFTSIARILPGKRVSGLARHNGAEVFAKFFYGKGARRYWQRELQGARRLRAGDVSTPEVMAAGASADGEGFVVFFEALNNPHDLRDDDLEDMLAAVQLLADMHDANLVQSDVHIFNFLRCDGRYFAIDTDGIRRAHLLRQHFANLAMLLAQRAPVADRDIDDVWAAYSAARGAYVSRMGSATQLRKLTLKARRQRVRRYLKKTQRPCTEFVQHANFRLNFLCDRDHFKRLQRFMLFPEAIVGDGTPLKLGNSSTVVRINLDDVPYIVKRYNIKGLSHRVRRWFKRRARRAWCNGHHLAFLKIATAKPIALLEQRWGWLNGVCYLVMPDCGERNLGQALANNPGEFDKLMPPTLLLLEGLQAAGLQHGDLKATNFVIDSPGVRLIDYDALRDGGNERDIKRFLANWNEQPELLERWQKALAEANL
jgi:tRNA A-37 threonylcarbamoyl transferase component Bud32